MSFATVMAAMRTARFPALTATAIAGATASLSTPISPAIATFTASAAPPRSSRNSASSNGRLALRLMGIAV